MRILFCNYEYPPLGGGGGVVNELLAQELAKRHDVTVLTSQGPGGPRVSSESGVKVLRVPIFFRSEEAVANLASMLSFILRSIPVGKNLVKMNAYDVINTHFVLPTGPVGDLLSRFAGIPNVLTVHGGDLYDPSKFTSPHRHPILRAWIRRLLKRADQVVAQSSNTVQNMWRYYTPDVHPVRIPLGIRKPEVGARSRKSHGFREDEILLVTIGRLIPRKAVTQLLSIMENLKGQKVRLLIVGTGPQEGVLKAESRERQLIDQVLFLGHVEESEKINILTMSDVYVSTSQHEGFGLVFLEAMACGLPVVSYDAGGQTDFLEDGKTGFLVALNNKELFTKRCQLLIDDLALRKRIGTDNRRYCEKYYVETCALNYESTFERVLETRRNANESRHPVRRSG